MCWSLEKSSQCIDCSVGFLLVGGEGGEEKGERRRGEGATFNELPMWGQVSYLFRSLSVENKMNVSN